MSRPHALRAALASAAALLGLAPGAAATHLSSVPLAQSPIRTPLGPDEGYLVFSPDPGPARDGAEWTGWMDLHPPSLAGPTDQEFGFDRSDRSVAVRTTTLIDATGGPAQPDVPRDLAFANRAFVQQAGLSLVETAHRTVLSGAPVPFLFPLDVGEETALAGALNAGAPTLDVYYATTLASDAFGETIVPSGGLGPPAVFMADFQAAPPPLPPIPVRPDTVSHEIGHFLTDGRAIHSENAAPDQAHSGDPGNLLAGANRAIPSGGGFGLLEIGPPRSATPGGPVVEGGKDQQSVRPDVPGGPFPTGQSQVGWIFAAPGAGNGATPWLTLGHHAAAGDRVDWDFVTDHLPLESVPGRADDAPGADALFWQIGFTRAADHTGHDHDAWEVVSLPDFTGPTFRFVDVFSLDAIFSDADVTQFGISSFQAPLDYAVFFRATDGSIVRGAPVEIFSQGFTTSAASDGVVRWASPVDAVGVLVRALESDGHDGIAQIDAVIVSAVPEPGATALAALGLTGLAGFGRRRALRRRAAPAPRALPRGALPACRRSEDRRRARRTGTAPPC